jgi:HPt (histidine-containing phosphotransfer) domain-containing protein
MFCEDAPERLQVARSSAAVEDFDGAERAAHMLKASAAILGATRVRLLSARVERLAARHDGDGVRALIGEWETSVQRARHDLAAAVEAAQ